MFTFSERSENNLKGVHPDLVKVARRALEISEVDFAVTEGLRTVQEQQELVKSGASWTYNSRHLTGHAIDVVAYLGGKVSWSWPLYYKIAEAFFKAAEELDIIIEWGGNWKGKHKDGPHYQLSWKKYPKNK